MLASPYLFEANLSPEDFEKIGRLSMKWSHTDHVLGNCLKRMLRLSDEEAIEIVFPMSFEQRMRKLSDLAKLKRLNKDARAALIELQYAINAVRYVRNNVAHAVVLNGRTGDSLFELRSRRRRLTKSQILNPRRSAITPLIALTLCDLH